MWYSTWNDASETAHIIGDRLHTGHDRRLPEYSYLDARGMGLFEGTSQTFAADEIAKIDARDPSEPPPATVDGTPNESVLNVATRVQQMVSIIETHSTGEDVLIVAPDSQILSIWQAAIAGAPLAGHAAFAVEPGQVVMCEYQMQHANGDPSTRAETFTTPGSDASALRRKLEKAAAIADEGEKKAVALGAAQLEAERGMLVAKLTKDLNGVEAAERTADKTEEKALLAKRQARQATDQEQQRQLRLATAGPAGKAKWLQAAAETKPVDLPKLAADYPVGAALAFGGLVRLGSVVKEQEERALWEREERARNEAASGSSIDDQLVAAMEKGSESKRRGDDMALACAAIEAEAAKAAERQYMATDDIIEQFIVATPLGEMDDEDGVWDDDAAEFDEWAASIAKLQEEVAAEL